MSGNGNVDRAASNGRFTRIQSRCGRCTSTKRTCGSENLPKSRVSLYPLHKETVSELLQVPVTKQTGTDSTYSFQRANWFAMVPASVLSRRDVSATGKLVWAAMAMLSIGSGRIAVSHRTISEACGVSRAHVLQSLRQLVSVGLAEKDGRPRGQVQPYRVLQLHTRTAPNIQPKPMFECTHCLRTVGGLMPDGLCRRCHAESKVRRIAREEILRDKRATA